MAYTDCKLLWESAKFGEDPYDFYTPLIVACKNGFTRIVEILCELGADLNLQGGWNKSTALIKATEKGYTDVVDVLLKRNVETDLCNTFDSTALMIASEKGYTEIVKKLLQIGVNTQLRNKDGYTALILAAEMGHLTCVKLLLQDKATATDIDVSNKFGKNALMMAAENGHYFVVEYLVSKGANVEAESKRGATAIILASMKGHIDVVVNLTPKADIYKRNNNGENAVSTACQNGFVEIVRHLLDYSRNYCTYQSTPFSPNSNQTGTGIKLADELDPMGNTLIMISCANGKDKKICKEAFDTKIFVPNYDSDEIEVEPTIESHSAVNPLIRNSSFDIGLNVNIPNHVTFSDNSVPIRSASISTNGHSRVHNSNHYDSLSQPFPFRTNPTIPHSISNENYNNINSNNSNNNNINQFTTLRYPAPDSNFDLRRQPTINSDFGMTRMVSSSTADELDQSGSEILFGVLSINIIRINELIRKCRLYEAKLRLFVRINFNNQVYTSKTTLNRSPNDPEVHFHDVAEFEILKLEQTEIIFEVYDSYQGVFPDRLLGTYRGSIKEWIANGRFEDSLDITEDKIIDGKVHTIVAGKLQINARMKYLTAEEIYLLTMKAKQKHQELFSEEDRKGIFDVPIRAFKSSNF
eukprot:gene18776-24543_t